MTSTSESLGPHPASFSSRRSAASNLPNFQLPPPDLQKFPGIGAINPTQPSPVNVGNLLTPPSNLPGDGLSPLSSGVNSNSSASTNPGVPPYTPVGFWQPPPPMNRETSYQSRPVFSPSLNSMVRNSNSPSAAESSLPPPPYDNLLPPFATSMPMSGPASTSLPNMGSQQQPMGGVFGPMHPTTQPSPVHAPEPYNPLRAPPTPSYYNSAPSSAQQATFPSSYTAPSPSQQSPMSSSAPGSRISPIASGSMQHPNQLQPALGPPTHHFQRPFNYSLPQMSGPIATNVHNPGGQMAVVGGSMPGGMMSAYGNHGNVSHMYGGQAHQQPQQNERPFKCDQCPQSFNRNHDLKRHKRIHLAVKPFPCTHCEKSFSRKDALKRHVLVKGCGKATASDSREDGSMSPPDRSEITSNSSGDDSPSMNGANVKNESS